MKPATKLLDTCSVLFPIFLYRFWRRLSFALRSAWLAIAVFYSYVCLGQRPAQGPMSLTHYNPAELGYVLIWEDEFNGPALDNNKWDVRGAGPRALGFISPEAVQVTNGCLLLKAYKKDGRILLGAVGTQDHFLTRYGFFECRAQLQKSPGIWAAFWIQSPEIANGEDPAHYGAEIDVMEFFKKLGPDIISHNVHWAYGPHQQTTHGMQSYLHGVSEDFHTFGISQIPEYMILSMETPNDAKDLKSAVFPDVFTVDYVRVYKKKEAGS